MAMGAGVSRNAGATGHSLHPAPVEVGLSIVVPLFNEAEGLPILHATLTAVVRRLRQERALTTEMIYRIHNAWKIPPELLIKPYRLRKAA